MLTDFVHLSVGGTLSMGGVGGTVQHVGAQVDNVLELQVVTGQGDLVTCSTRRNRGLFDNVRGGAGQSVLRFPFPGSTDDGIARMLAQNRALHDRAVALGGKRYIIGSIPDTTAEDWRRHYGDLWPRFRAAKRRYDPDGILTPGQGIFGERPRLRAGGGG